MSIGSPGRSSSDVVVVAAVVEVVGAVVVVVLAVVASDEVVVSTPEFPQAPIRRRATEIVRWRWAVLFMVPNYVEGGLT
jgi:hypothetical protein